jgi:hypothetical protein
MEQDLILYLGLWQSFAFPQMTANIISRIQHKLQIIDELIL